MNLAEVRESVRAVLDKVPGGAQRVLDAIRDEKIIAAPYVAGDCGCFVAKAIAAESGDTVSDWKVVEFPQIDADFELLPVEHYLVSGWRDRSHTDNSLEVPHERIMVLQQWVHEWMADNGQVPQ